MKTAQTYEGKNGCVRQLELNIVSLTNINLVVAK